MKRRMFKRLTACAVALITLAAMLPISTVAQASQERVDYTKYEWNYIEGRLIAHNDRSTVFYTVVTNSLMNDNPDGLTTGDYVVDSNTTINERVKIKKGANVNLIVQPNVTLTCNKGIGCGFKNSNEYATLNICGSGKLIANADNKNAAIGGDDDETSGDIRIHGCKIEATGGKHGAGIGGGEGGKDPDDTTSIDIYAGDITATGGVDAAGIGGGDEQQGALTYIYGGKINAKSEKHGAGIGGGDEENTRGIYIYDGNITAKGGGHGAGIGAGEHGGNIHEIKITGGTIDTTGGSGGAGIGGGFDEDMDGEINISGDVHLTVKAGEGAAGIGAGAGGDWGPEGDMKGTIKIDARANSDIKVYALNTEVFEHGSTWTSYIYDYDQNDYDGAGIGAGHAGNMYGEVYITGGKMEIYSGVGGAGIGGGMEDVCQGGEGNDVYIGGGDIKIITVCKSDIGNDNEYTDNHAIGRGHKDYKDGSVYIHPNNNTTGKYMKVVYTKYGRYMDDEREETQTAKASDRSKKCHTRSELHITECNHKDHNGNSGLSYTIVDGDKHRVKCKYCGLDIVEDHDGSIPCGDCGYRDGVTYYSVTLNTQFGDPVQLDTTFQYVASGKKFTFPECDKVPTGKRFIGWRLVNDTYLRQPGESFEPGSNRTYDAVYADLYSITYDHTLPNGNWISLNKSAADEDEEITVKGNPVGGYRMKTVTVRENDENGEKLYEIEVEQGKTQCSFTMPAKNVYITAEFEEAGYFVNISDSENGKVTTELDSFAYSVFANDFHPTVTLTVTPDEGFVLSDISCKTESGTDVEVTQIGESNQYTFAMPQANVKVSADFDVYHNLTLINAVNSAGDVKYWHCGDNNCDKYYSEVGGEYTEITDADTCAFLAKAETAVTVDGTNDVIAINNPDIANEGYIGTRFLGVQKAALNGEETKNRSLRFVTEVSSDILKTLNSDESTDYGFVFAALNKNSESDYDKLTVTHSAAHKYSCKGTTNTISEIFGNEKYTDGEDGYTPYKYVTASLYNIPENAKLAARFYITYKGTTYYINYASRNGVTGTAFDADELLSNN